MKRLTFKFDYYSSQCVRSGSSLSCCILRDTSILHRDYAIFLATLETFGYHSQLLIAPMAEEGSAVLHEITAEKTSISSPMPDLRSSASRIESFQCLIEKICQTCSCESNLPFSNIKRILLITARQCKRTVAIFDRRDINGFLGKIEAFLDPIAFVRLQRLLSVCRRQIAGRLDGLSGSRIRLAEEVVPERMQLACSIAGQSTTDFHSVAAGIAAGFISIKPRRRVQRLM